MVTYSTARWTGGLRGAGLGNEALAWAKAFVASTVLEHSLLAPQWLLNKYSLGRQLGIPRRSMARAHAEALVCGFQVTEELFLSAESLDYGEAMRTLEARGAFSSARVLVHSGMWGGWRSVARARPFLHQQLLASPGTSKFLSGLPSLPVPTIGVHVRRGDFDVSPPDPGQFNSALPIEWYAAVMQLFRVSHPRGVHFLVCSDASDAELAAIMAPDSTVVRGSGPSAPAQELMALSSADALIASVSSFSMLAAFISCRPYVWYQGQLTQTEGGWQVWDDQHARRARLHVEASEVPALPYHRGVPVSESTHELPAWLTTWLEANAEFRRPDTDLLQLGQIPTPGPDARFIRP